MLLCEHNNSVSWPHTIQIEFPVLVYIGLRRFYFLNHHCIEVCPNPFSIRRKANQSHPINKWSNVVMPAICITLWCETRAFSLNQSRFWRNWQHMCVWRFLYTTHITVFALDRTDFGSDTFHVWAYWGWRAALTREIVRNSWAWLLHMQRITIRRYRKLTHFYACNLVDCSWRV